MKKAACLNLFEIVGNILGTTLYVFFAGAILIHLMDHFRWSGVLLLIQTSLFAFFFIIRKPPTEANTSIYEWCIGIAGTFAPILMRPVAGFDHAAFQTMQLAGLCISIVGILSLNRSIGLVAANRGVRTRGAYQFVRHPIYAGYFLSFLAFWAQNISVLNTIWLALWMALEIMRMAAEEKRLLMYTEYVVYAQRVRWRLLPYIY